MSVIKEIEQGFKKSHVVDVKSGDVVRVHQKIREGNKERVQVFEGLVILTKRKNSLSSSITVRRISSGVGVEKTFLIHSPLVTKIEVVKRSKVRRNYLSYMRERTGKSARLSAVDFDQDKVNYVPEPEVKQSSSTEASADTEALADKMEDKEPKAEEPAQVEEKSKEPEEAKAEEQKPAEEPKPEAKKEHQEDKPADQAKNKDGKAEAEAKK